MAKRQPGRGDSLLLTPFGRLGRALGFRWAFPIGTMAVPYHPLIPVMVLGLPMIWLVQALADRISGSAGGWQWPWMILAGVLLAIPLSIPIVNWAFRMFGALLAQSLLFLAAMVVLAGDVAAGRAGPAWAVLPAGYVLVYIIQRVGGLWRLRGYRCLIAAYTPVCAGERPLIVQSDERSFALAAIRQGLIERAHVAPPSYDGTRIIEPVDQAEVTALEELNQKQLPRSWRIDGSAPHITINRSGELPAGPTVRIETERTGRRIGNWPGITRWRIFDRDEVFETVTGTARIAGPIPLIVLFCDISITGGGSQWIAGFMPRDIRLTPNERDDPANILAPLQAVPPRGENQRQALIAEARAAFRADEARDRAKAAERADLIRERARAGLPTRIVVGGHGFAEISGRIDPALFWREVTTDPSRWVAHRQTYLAIAAKAGECDREDLRRTLNWLEAAIQLRARDAIVAAAKLLAAMAQPLLASDYARLMHLLNSRIVGMVWRITPDFDVKPLPPKVPKFGDEAGYGLIRAVPELYLKLADLGPEMEEMIIRLVEEAVRYDVSLPPELAAMAQPPVAKE